MTPTRAYGLLLLVTLMWAGTFPLGKLALLELGPLTLSAARAALAAPVLVLIARLAHGPFPAFTRSHHWTFVVISLTGLVGNTTVWYWGLQHTSPVNAGILGASAPVIVALAGAAWLGDPLSRRNVLGIAVTIGAVLLTVSHGSLEVLRTLSFNRGDLIILASQLAWVSYTLFSRASRSQLPSLTVQAGAHVVSLVVLAPLALLERLGLDRLRGRPHRARAYLVLPVHPRGGGGPRRRLHEPDPVHRDRPVVADPGRADPLVPLQGGDGRDRRRRAGDGAAARGPVRQV